MDTQAHLEKNQYVATAADIENLTKEQLTAVSTQVRGRTTYLRALIATTQDKLGVALRQRMQGQPTKLTPEGITAQLTALEEVHGGFYEAVLKAIDDTPLADDEKPKTGRGSANAIKTRRATFARTAKSTVRSWIKAGHDIAAIAASKVTKAAITLKTGQRRRRAVSPKRLVSRVEKQSKVLIASLLELAETDKEAAVKEYQTVMNVMSDQLIRLGMEATKDAGVAVAERRPLRIKKTIFVPTQTQVLRQQARPS
jgi:hypothetical protein